MAEDIQCEVRNIISEIEEKSADGTYIYRGERKTHEGPPYYGKVSSSLWRELRLELEHFHIRQIEQEMLKTAKKHTGHPQQSLVADSLSTWGLHKGEGAEKPRLVSVDLAKVGKKYPSETEFELLTEIQHYGGKTNLIDFTTDYLIALFFACDGHHDKDGRVILQETEEIKDMINRPRNPQHRVIAQKSVFVHPTEGFIEPHEKDIVIIPANLKQPLLERLENITVCPPKLSTMTSMASLETRAFTFIGMPTQSFIEVLPVNKEGMKRPLPKKNRSVIKKLLSIIPNQLNSILI